MACNHRAAHVCSIIPPKLIQHIIAHPETSEPSRAAAQKTYNHMIRLHAARAANPQGHEVQGLMAHSHGQSASAHAPAAPPRRGLIPPKVFQAMSESEETTDEQKERAHKNLRTIGKFNDAATNAGSASSGSQTVYREIYTAAKSDNMFTKLLFKEGAAISTQTDGDGKNVYKYFGDTFQFYEEVFKRYSVDGKGLHLKGSVHYDDEPGPPGMDNAFWDGKEMAFGDGDGQIFGSFTKNIDVIGHELTHGVTQYTAELEYEYQSGALNESISDVFGTMIKQYFGGPNGGKQKAADADWLIGEGIFLPAVTNAKALRSMKAPGTAYDNAKVGKDDQPATMDGYQDLPNTAAGDQGGVHTNSGIPNHAFYLAATALGGYSWEKAGPVWYAALNDPSIKGIDTKGAFKVFADLTVKYAGSMFDADTQAKVKKAWVDVKVLTDSSTGDGEL